MQDVLTWLRKRPEDLGAPWLILGKGPSFERRTEFDLTRFRKLSLNHVVRELSVDLAHIIDIDVIDACESFLERNARAVVMPWHPHVNQRFDARTLEDWTREKASLGRLREQGRLLWYNLKRPDAEVRAGSPEIEVRFFSGEAALNVLATAGVRVVRSLGVDGGRSYGGTFADIASSTLLANGRTSFDRQFERMAEIIFRSGIDFAPLDLESPVRVYVACSESELLPVRILEYSLRKKASINVEVVPLCNAGVQFPLPRDAKNQPRTPFSFQRFAIPEIAGRQGRAIYLDSDMQVFRDFRSLWSVPMKGVEILTVRQPEGGFRAPQFSVMVLDCEKLDWDLTEIVSRLDNGLLTYEQLMYEMRVGGRTASALPEYWNHLEFFDPNTTGILHYTDMNTQPWVDTQNPLGYLWCRDMLDAIRSGWISRDFVKDQVVGRHVRPSLIAQIDEAADDPLLLPERILALDRAFRAPYKHLSSRRAGLSARMKAVIRHWYHGSLAQSKVRKLKERR